MKNSWAVALYPGAIHVRDVGLQSADDEVDWSYALQYALMIVFKDSDFRQHSFLFAHPPKVIWIRRGNCSTTEMAALLRANHNNLLTFAQDQEDLSLALT